MSKENKVATLRRFDKSISGGLSEKVTASLNSYYQSLSNLDQEYITGRLFLENWLVQSKEHESKLYQYYQGHKKRVRKIVFKLVGRF